MSSEEEDFILAAYYRRKAKKKRRVRKNIPHQQRGKTALRVIKEPEVPNESAMDYEEDFNESPPLLQLNSNEMYDYCGKVFITKNKYLALHCLLCENKYGTLIHFLKHLTMCHYNQKENKLIEENGDIWSHEYLDEQKSGHGNEINVIPELPTVEPESNDGDEDLQSNNSEFVKSQYKKASDFSDMDPFLPFFKKKPDSFQCDQCGKHFRTKSGLEQHIRRHSDARNYKCTICGIAFKERSNCVAHIKRHTGEKKYDCRQCGKRFFTRSEIERHHRTHTGERPYVCATCGRDFSAAIDLKRHMMRHNNIRPYQCTFCEKKFFTGHSLRNHIRVHTNERPFVCTICSASFKRQTTLKQHNKLHINARSYACNICDKTFNQKPALLSHMKIHHKIL